MTSSERLPSLPVADRLRALHGSLAESELDALLIGHPPRVRYSCGFSGSSGLLVLLADGGGWLATDFRYEEQAAESLPPELSLEIARDGLWKLVGKRLADRGRATIGFESDWLTVGDLETLQEAAPQARWEAAPSWIDDLRAVKGPEELARLDLAARRAESALDRVLASVEEGRTEAELAAELEYELRRAGSGRLPFDVIVASGPRSSLPHAEPGERRLEEGDLLLLDFGAAADGYCSDVTRTVVLGAASDWQREVHAAVLEAQRAAIAAIRPDRAAKDVDRVAREALEAHGLAERFGHSTGHGIGLEVHEAPRLARTSDDRLAAGHVVTVEPGVYLPGRGGVRVEDDVVVEEEGARTITAYPRALREL